MFRIGLVLFLIFASLSTALAQDGRDMSNARLGIYCVPYAPPLIASLSSVMELRGQSLAGNKLMQLWIGPNRWSFTMTLPSGEICLVASGDEDWQPIKPMGDPA